MNLQDESADAGWEPLLGELARRTALTHAMGGVDRLSRPTARRHLNARDPIARTLRSAVQIDAAQHEIRPLETRREYAR